jgi:hypothetical protein
MKVENCVLTDLHWFVLLEVVDSTSDLHEITSFPLSLTTFLKCDMMRYDGVFARQPSNFSRVAREYF